ncbi:hypothetical protein EV682_10331 [Iodobacter fluviatilis]|uniref:Uncharacterized protein n=1 Tax=Iodobacter fluviatilis TaxID=537 RepID=A0ABY2CDM3_9NEIS|nr:hypothetical protein EV682_10331 [Iodobacter fluviatilis]
MRSVCLRIAQGQVCLLQWDLHVRIRLRDKSPNVCGFNYDNCGSL